ncbi:MAG: 6,7-dimethyl-8-ribityllumazine synthase [Kiritimatiellae bacterium]|nr:6,7-dimethyl-8-ribityllumazine synthase [Kiritimatiellia bacterium]
MTEISAGLVAKDMKIAVVASRFNSFLTDQLVKGAIDAFVRHGGKDADIVIVKAPGAYELPLAAKKLAKSGKFDAVVALGVVVQGATPHASLINETTARAFSEISMAEMVPVIDGVVSAESLEQAVERCGTKQGNKGFSAMQAAIEMADLMRKM